MELKTTWAQIVNDYKTTTPYDVLNVALLSNNRIYLPLNVFPNMGEYVRRVAQDDAEIHLPYSSQFPVEIIVKNTESVRAKIQAYVELCSSI